MCGITGYWQQQETTDTRQVLAMTRLLAPRGPDDEGYWLWNQSEQKGRSFSGDDSMQQIRKELPDLKAYPHVSHHLAFGHRRYAIIDLSEAGHQPMVLHDIALLFNGEIYNFQELRKQLEDLGMPFHTHTDAEVIVQAYRQWGSDCFVRFRGFFAIVLFDIRRNSILMARDPLGKAPLYLLRKSGSCFFASDIKPLLNACPEERHHISSEAVSAYIGSGLRDFNNGTFWKNINTLPAASWLEFDLASGQTNSGVYWNIPTKRFADSEMPIEAATVQLRHLLETSVERRLVADRPVGFTLSGGLDSSSLLALYAQNPQRPKVPVFTVQYADPKYDETAYARKVIQRYPAHFEHIIINGSERTIGDEWDAFMQVQEEPFHDPALFTDYYQQRIIKSHGVDININGAGGDELLAGYPAYYPPHMRWLWRQGVTKWPGIAADAVGIMENMPLSDIWKSVKRKWGPGSAPDSNRFLLQQSPQPLPVSGDFSAAMRQRMSDWLLFYWMRSQHKNYMHIPVEPRLPFLDVDLVDFCFTVPPEYLIRGGWTKYLLRRAMAVILPPEIVWRKRKMGFPFDTATFLAQHGPALKAQLQQDIDNPWVDIPAVLQSYSNLLKSDAQLLWRLVCFSAWHVKMIRQEALYS